MQSGNRIIMWRSCRKTHAFAFRPIYCISKFKEYLQILNSNADLLSSSLCQSEKKNRSQCNGWAPFLLKAPTNTAAEKSRSA